MPIVQRLKAELDDTFRSFRIFQVIIASICISLPALLVWADHNKPNASTMPFRESISAYVHIERSYIFGMLMCMAAMLFIVNGVVYFKNQDTRLKLESTGKWYNMILGISLLGVILFVHDELRTLHIIFATIFFLGNAVVTGIFHHGVRKRLSLTLALLTVAAFAIHLIDDSLITMFWAEWFSLVVIAIHLILQGIKVMALSRK